MRPARSLRRPRLRALLCAGLVVHLAGCGTLLYPERQGRHAGRVDPGIVVLDGVLLFFFIVPGLVAYGIDFYTGAIYLPGGGRHAVVVPAPGGDLSDAAVRALVAERTGVAWPPELKARSLPCPDVATLESWLGSEPQPGDRAAMLRNLSQGG